MRTRFVPKSSEVTHSIPICHAPLITAHTVKYHIAPMRFLHTDKKRQLDAVEFQLFEKERGGVVVERRAPNREVLGSMPHWRHRVVSLSKTH